jgi:hypothetical protein
LPRKPRGGRGATEDRIWEVEEEEEEEVEEEEPPDGRGRGSRAEPWAARRVLSDWGGDVLCVGYTE